MTDAKVKTSAWRVVASKNFVVLRHRRRLRPGQVRPVATIERDRAERSAVHGSTSAPINVSQDVTRTNMFARPLVQPAAVQDRGRGRPGIRRHDPDDDQHVLGAADRRSRAVYGSARPALRLVVVRERAAIRHARSTQPTCGERSRSPNAGGDRRRRTRWSAPSSLPAMTSSARDITRATAGRTPRSTRCAQAGDRARGRDAVRDARAMRAPRQDAAVRRRDHRRGRRARRRSPCAIRAPSRAAASSDCAPPAFRSTSASSATPRSSSTRRSSTRRRQRPAVGDAQARAVRRRRDRRSDVARIAGSPARSRAREVHRLRADADAIAVGIGTVLADDPELTVRDVPAPRVPPRRVVFDSTLRTPLDSRARAHRARDPHDHRVRRSRRVRCDRVAALERRGRARRRTRPTLRDASRDAAPTAFARCSSRAAPRSPARSSRDRSSTASLSFGHRSCSATARRKAFAFAPPGFEASLDAASASSSGDGSATTS